MGWSSPFLIHLPVCLHSACLNIPVAAQELRSEGETVTTAPHEAPKVWVLHLMVGHLAQKLHPVLPAASEKRGKNQGLSCPMKHHPSKRWGGLKLATQVMFSPRDLLPHEVLWNLHLCPSLNGAPRVLHAT